MAEDHSHLYEVRVEKLGLSVKALNAVKRTGITSIGDCVNFYHIAAFAMIEVAYPVMNIMYGEVKEKLKEHGYWSYVEREE